MKRNALDVKVLDKSEACLYSLLEISFELLPESGETSEGSRGVTRVD